VGNEKFPTLLGCLTQKEDLTMYAYHNNCVSWDEDTHKEGGLCQMIDNSIEITRRTFMKHVNRISLQIIEDSLGYDRHPKQGMTMASDWHVSYHRSKLYGETVYYFRHSAIEYIFTQQED
jgi:hypothetical protein